MLRRMKTWSEMLTEKEVRKSKVYHVGAKFVYDGDGSDLPEGLSASMGNVLCLQRPHGISATQMPGTADDWIVIGGGSSGGSCNCGFTAALKAKLNAMPTIVLKDATTLTINGTDYLLTPASTPKYTLTVVVNNTKMGTATGGGQYSSGATATLVATAAAGYHFVSWNDGNTQATRTVTVTGNKTYTATFEVDTPSTYILMVQSSDTSLGSVTGGGNYAAGVAATIKATPEPGCHFVQWDDGNTQSTRTVIVTSNKTYTAMFEEDVALTPDFYTGFTSGSKSEFESLSDAEVETLVTGYSSTATPTYNGSFGSHLIFCLLYKPANPPTSIVLTSSGQSMTQDIVGDNTCPHADVTIGSETFKVFGVRLLPGHDASDSMTVIFGNNL